MSKIIMGIIALYTQAFIIYGLVGLGFKLIGY